MGGELRPELQSKIFAADRSKYPLGDEKQAWSVCEYNACELVGQQLCFSDHNR